VKRYIITNFATMVMAFLLALLTWVYLFTQGNGPGEVEVQFLPRLDMKDFASVTWEDEQGRELVPERSMRIRVLGPKVEVGSLRPNDYACEFRIDPKDLKGAQGTFRRPLTRNDFNLRSNISIDQLPLVTVRYVRFEERTLEIQADRSSYEGSLRPGYEIESITPIPHRIKARVPADKPGVEKVWIRNVPVEGKIESFTLSGWYLSGLAGDLKIQPLEPFAVEVKIALRPATKQFSSDLNVSAKPDNLKRIELETRTVTIEIRGPEDLVQEASQRPAAFAPFVLVTDKDMEPAGSKNISELGCHILDPKYQGKIEVVLMADVKPENRQAKIKVLPK
jgi:YbbR domain-containing protein